MSSKLKAGTSTSGAVLDADTTGILELQTGSTPTTAVTIDTSQNVGIGTTSPTQKLQVAGYGFFSGANNGTILGESNCLIVGDSATTNSANMVFYTANTERMRIDSSGNLLFNTTTIYGSAKFNLSFVGNANSGIMINDSTNTNGATMQVFYKTGTLIGSITNNNNTGVLYNVTSDYRLKNNTVSLTGAKDFVMALKPRAWDWHDDLGKGVGFIAHEFMEIAKYSGFGEKDAIDKDGNPVYQTIQSSSSEVMANIVAFIQEQQESIQELKAQVDAQALEIQALKGTA